MAETEQLRGRLADGSVVVLTIDADGSIAAIDVLADGGADDIPLLLAAALEPHAHLDKAFLADDVENETGDLVGAIAAMQRARPQLGVAETAERAERAVHALAAGGYRAVRTHVDVTTDNGLVSVEALAEVRRRVGDAVDIEIVALSGFPVTGAGGAAQRSLLVDALAAGADLIGGCPHLEHVAPGHADVEALSRAATETYLTIAADAGVDVDLHTDETLDPAADGLAELAELAVGFPGRITASHCVSLAMRPEAEQRRIAEAVATAAIGVIALPATNLYLQGRAHQQAMPRGLTAVKALLEAGVTVAAGADNVQDPFNPLGRFSPFETAALMVWCAHLSPADAWGLVTDGAAAVLGAGARTIAVGEPADLIATPFASLRQALAAGGFGSVAVRAGRPLAG